MKKYVNNVAVEMTAEEIAEMTSDTPTPDSTDELYAYLLDVDYRLMLLEEGFTEGGET